MIEVKRGEIWLVSLDPTIGHEIKKTRPSLIIQNDNGNKNSPLTIIAPITSQNLDRVYPIEVLLSRGVSGIEKDSKVLLDQIRTVDKRRLIKRVGRVNEDLIAQVNQALKISLGL